MENALYLLRYLCHSQTDGPTWDKGYYYLLEEVPHSGDDTPESEKLWAMTEHLKWGGRLSDGAHLHEDVGTSNTWRCGSQGPGSVRFVVELDDLKGQPKKSSDSMIQRYQLLELLLECIDLFIWSRQLMDLINFFQFSLLVEEWYNLSYQKREWSQFKKKKKKDFSGKKKNKPKPKPFTL